MQRLEIILELTTMIYDAASDRSLWPAFLDKLADAIDAEGTVLFAIDPTAPGRSLDAMTRFDPELIQLYATDFADNIWTRRADELFTPFQVRYSQALATSRELRLDRYYADFLAPANVAHSIGVKIGFGGPLPAYLATSRSMRKDAFEEPEGGLLLTLAPHIGRALALHRRLEGRLLFTELMDRLPTGILIADPGCHPIWWNRCAHDIFQLRDGLWIDPAGLRTARPREGERLRALIRRASKPETSPPNIGGAIAITRPSLRRSFAVMVSPLARHATNLRNAAVAVLITDPDRAPALGMAERLASQFQLTPAEGKVAAALAQGNSAEFTADLLSLSLATVRAHIRSLLRKTSTNSQPQLIRVLLSGPYLLDRY